MERPAGGTAESERREAETLSIRHWLALTTVCAAWVSSAVAAPSNFSFEYRSYVDTGAAYTDQTKTWLDGGSGKGRYGANSSGENRFKPVFSEAGLIGDAAFGQAIRAHLQIKFDDQQRHILDIAEGYLSYKSPARGFAVHDRELAVFDRTPLPRVHSAARNRFGPFAGLANLYEPLHEIDGRPGHYIGVNVRSAMIGRFSLMYYDNNGDPAAGPHAL